MERDLDVTEDGRAAEDETERADGMNDDADAYYSRCGMRITWFTSTMIRRRAGMRASACACVHAPPAVARNKVVVNVTPTAHSTAALAAVVAAAEAAAGPMLNEMLREHSRGKKDMCVCVCS